MLQNLIDINTEEPAPLVEPERPTLGERLNEALRRLDERYPRLSRWAGGRLDWELSAVSVSIGVHLALLIALGLKGYSDARAGNHRFEAIAVDTGLSELDGMQPFQDIDQNADTPNTPAVGSFSPNLATAISAGTMDEATAARGIDSDKKTGAAIDLAKLDIQRVTESLLPTASTYSKTVAIKGTGAEHVGSAEGAVDRLADEILRRLEKSRTLVVWAFDASGSLQVERERLAKHIDSIYAHITRRDEKSLASDGGLLTAVVAFGQSHKAMTESPTADPAAIIKAIRSVPLDESGIESTFSTVADIVRTYRLYKDAEGNPYKTMVIVVTDEIGDDEAQLEAAIDVAVKARVPVYVLGSQAIFSREMGRMNYRDPKTGQMHYGLEVRQGPESVMLEQIRLPFWYGGNPLDMLDSGFGPYALSRLAEATNGIFFITRLGETRMGFDPVKLREYKPDWMSRNQYEKAVRNHPIRAAVVNAALLTQEKVPGMPSLRFPAADGPEFKQTMERNQAIVADTNTPVEAALEPIAAVAKYRDRETSRRWQAHYDLIRGRLLAMKVRCDEYNWICAKMKKDAPKFTKPDNNAWRLVPDDEVHYPKNVVKRQAGGRAPEKGRRRASGNALVRARQARARSAHGLQVDRDLREADRPEQQQRRGSRQEEGDDEEHAEAGGTAQALVFSRCIRAPSSALGLNTLQ